MEVTREMVLSMGVDVKENLSGAFVVWASTSNLPPVFGRDLDVEGSIVEDTGSVVMSAIVVLRALYSRSRWIGSSGL